MSAQYHGQCHCGRLTWTVNRLPETVTHCNCSICRRYGAVWAYYARREVVLSDNEGVGKAYRWNDKVIDFVHCGICGCLSHYEDVQQGPDERVAVNVRLCADPVWDTVKIRRFDGAVSFREITDG